MKFSEKKITNLREMGKIHRICTVGGFEICKYKNCNCTVTCSLQSDADQFSQPCHHDEASRMCLCILGRRIFNQAYVQRPQGAASGSHQQDAHHKKAAAVQSCDWKTVSKNISHNASSLASGLVANAVAKQNGVQLWTSSMTSHAP